MCRCRWWRSRSARTPIPSSSRRWRPPPAAPSSSRTTWWRHSGRRRGTSERAEIAVRHRLAAPVALAAAVVVFFGVFLFTRSLLWPPLLAGVAAFGVYLMVDDRSPVKVESDNYAEEADQKVGDALRTVKELQRLARDVQRPPARAALEGACRYVPELFERVKAKSPNSLYSTASQIGGHLTSLEGAVKQYLDIQRNPVLYTDPESLAKSGE